MFEVENEVLELRFNMQKVKTLENMYGISIMAEISKNRGMMSFHLMEGLFSVALYNVTTEQNVKGKKAIDVFNSLMQETGYADLNAVILGKLQADMGFLFLNS